MTSRSNAEIDIRCGQTQLAEKDLRHPVVVVLAGVHQSLREIKSRKRGDDRCRLREVRPRTGDMQNRCRLDRCSGAHGDLSSGAGGPIPPPAPVTPGSGTGRMNHRPSQRRSECPDKDLGPARGSHLS